MPDPSNIRIDGARLWDSLMEMAKIGATPKGGCKRLTLTDLDRQGRDLFARWCAEAGLGMTVDRMGNMFARRRGEDESLPPVVMGSHLDTQPTGGKFDGVLGVLGGLEVMRSLNDLNMRTRHPIEVANWTNEEGSRFAPAMVASGVFARAYTLDEAYGVTDRDGLRLGDELERIGFKGDAPVGGRDIHAFFELHIEQGPLLADEGVDIGVGWCLAGRHRRDRGRGETRGEDRAGVLLRGGGLRSRLCRGRAPRCRALRPQPSRHRVGRGA